MIASMKDVPPLLIAMTMDGCAIIKSPLDQRDNPARWTRWLAKLLNLYAMEEKIDIYESAARINGISFKLSLPCMWICKVFCGTNYSSRRN